jgi:hypothetical protein
LQRFAFHETYGRAPSSALQRDFFFLHPALKEWVRANRDGSRPWRSTQLIVGQGLTYEAAQPVLRLGLVDDHPTIRINGTALLQPIPGRGRASYPIRFLFLALCAWKLRSGGGVWPTISQINQLKSHLAKAHPGLALPHIAPDQSENGSPVRNWARRINHERDLEALCRGEYVGPERRDTGPRSKNSKRPDRRRTGFITVHASSGSGADARVAFPHLEARDIYVEDAIRLPRY